MSAVGSSSTVQPRRSSGRLPGCVGRPVVGDGSGHRTRSTSCEARASRASRRPSASGSTRRPRGAGSARFAASRTYLRPAPAPRRRARRPCGPRSGCRRSARRRAARGVPPALTSTRLPASAPRARAATRTRATISPARPSGPPHLALGRVALVRADQLDAARAERLDVGARRRVRPHARVHRGRDEHGPAVRERRLGEQVVGEPVRELGQRVRRAGRDDQQVGARQVRVEVVRRRPARERGERLGADEPLGARRDERITSWPAFTSRRDSSHAL